MQIIHCCEKYRKDWDDFLDGTLTSSFYHLFGWKKIMESRLGHETFYLAAMEEGKILGVLPLIYINSLAFGKILCSMPFLNFGGICTADHQIEFALLTEAKNIVKRYNIVYLELRNNRRLTEILPTSEHKISMTLNLDADPDVLWKNLKSKQRTTIRRVYKNSLHIQIGNEELLDSFYTILAKSWRALGTPIYTKSFFLDILKMFPGKTKIFIVNHQDAPVAAAFNGYYQGVVEGMWMGTDPHHRALEPNYVLYWEMIKHGCENGFKRFHLGRSTVDSGGSFFKSKWNAEEQQLYWQYHLGTTNSMPQLNVDNPKYKYAIGIWKKLPLTLTTILGPHIARNIP